MTNAQTITKIRAHLHDGQPLDAWEVALESGDKVALAYVREYTGPVTMSYDTCSSCHGNRLRWLCRHCDDGISRAGLIELAGRWIADWTPSEPLSHTRYHPAELQWCNESVEKTRDMPDASFWMSATYREPKYPHVWRHLVEMWSGFIGQPQRSTSSYPFEIEGHASWHPRARRQHEDKRDR